MLDYPKEIFIKKYNDNRGFFQETFNLNIKNLLGTEFVQDNESYSKKGVIRGMHYQWDSPMGKLVRCSYGNIMDVVVDIRKNSKFFGEVYYFNLSSDKGNLLWVPPGFAHGFESLSDFSMVAYKCTTYYNKDGESGLNPNDKDLNIKWKAQAPVFSKKDISSKSFKEYSNLPKF